MTRKLPAYERAATLRAISAGIRARREELGRLIALEAGKPIRDALVEVDRATLTFRLGAEEAERIGGELMPLDLMASSKGRIGITRRFPVGPVAAISPFNFPLNLAAHKLAPAIAAGCSIVLKPPSKDPLTMLTVAEIVEEAGAPAGSVSILPMSRELGDRLVADDRFKLLTFTGSPAVGWDMKARAGKKKVVLELGGNAGAIVDRTADLDWAVRRITVGAFAYAGQVCISVQRIFVHDDVFDAFVEKFTAAAARAAARRPARPRDRPRPDGRREGARSATQAWVDEAVAHGRPGPPGREGGRHASSPRRSSPTRRSRRRSAARRRSRRSSSSSASPTSTTPSGGSTPRTSASRPASSRTTWPTPSPPSTSSRSAASSSTTSRPTGSTTCPTAA